MHRLKPVSLIHERGKTASELSHIMYSDLVDTEFVLLFNRLAFK